MTRWNRPMAAYRSSMPKCASCGGSFRDRGDVKAEVRMVDGQPYHPTCAPKEAAS